MEADCVQCFSVIFSIWWSYNNVERSKLILSIEENKLTEEHKDEHDNNLENGMDKDLSPVISQNEHLLLS